MKQKTKYIIEAVRPQPERGNYFLALHGFGTLFFTNDRAKAETYDTRKAAESRINDLFEPGYYRAVTN